MVTVLIIEFISLLCLIAMLIMHTYDANKHNQRVDYIHYLIIWFLAAIRNLVDLIQVVMSVYGGK